MKDQKKWDKAVLMNTDPYGKCCIDVAREVMKMLDQDPTPLKKASYPDSHTAHLLIVKADHEIDAGGITMYMASVVASLIFECHERGNEFRISFNDEDESDGVVNKAMFSFE